MSPNCFHRIRMTSESGTCFEEVSFEPEYWVFCSLCRCSALFWCNTTLQYGQTILLTSHFSDVVLDWKCLWLNNVHYKNTFTADIGNGFKKLIVLECVLQ